ncbi:MFS transporter [Kribbella qitaiheensis]|uniref:MFS transporter n=1 Tax=Kribbella qitaiheensis TaxID=1544730 RepID=A0A7G6X6A9_9ACTN|nr:MFS transporter [Kribbella qitaiheensis]QNE21774.1 MFS transporter [Kribbella qitaiheensis]
MNSLLLRHRDFRLLWIGETTSKFGSSVTTVVLPLIAVTTLQASTLAIGLLGATVWLPWLLIGLPAGAWVDRLPHRPIMLISAALSAVLLAVVPAAAAAGLLSLQLLFMIAFLTGIAAVFFQTAYTAYLPNLVTASDRAEGNAKLQGSASAAQIAGLGCGGLAVQLFGAVNGLVIDALTFVASFACIAAIHYRETRQPAPPEQSLVRDVAQGIQLVGADVWLRTLIVFGATSNLALMGYQSIIVVFLIREVGVGASTVGGLIAGASAGGVLGAFAARRVADRIGTARATLFFELVLPAAALLIPLTTRGYGVLLYLTGGFCVGAGVVAGNVIKSTFQQEYCAPEFRGRLAATGSFVNLGTIPLGSALGGVLGTAFDLRTALWISTVGVPLAGLILIFSPIRRVRDLPLDGQAQGCGVPGVAESSRRVRTD